MIRQDSQWLRNGFLTAVIAGLILVAPYIRSQETPDLRKIPPKVMTGLKAKFPRAEIHKWTREKENETAVYDIEFTQGGTTFEADIAADGAIHNWEREIAADDLPQVVKQSVEKRYPGSTLREGMAVTAVKGGKDALEGYEILLLTADQKGVEVTVAPDGRILEDSGQQK